MKFLKWLLPIVVTCLCSTISFSQIHASDSAAIIKLRDDLGLSSVATLPSNDLAVWIPIYIDTVYDQTLASFKITRINFDNLVSAPATTYTVLPDSIITDTDLNLLEYLSLYNNGIDSIEGRLYPPSLPGLPPALEELNLGNNTFSNTTDFFNFCLLGMTNLEVLEADNALISNGTLLSNYIIPSSLTLYHLDISGNGFTGFLDVLGFATSRFPSLRFLYADNNALNSVVTPTTTSSMLLEKLSVDNNLLLDFEPLVNLLNNASTMRWLYASNAMDTSTVQDSLEFAILTPLLNLEILDISGNRLRGVLPADMFERLPNINVLLLNDNLIRGRLPRPINSTLTVTNGIGYLGFDHLAELDLSNNLLEGELRIDWLFNNQLVNLITGSPTAIEYFAANNNQFSAIKPSLNNTNSTTLLTDPQFNNRFLTLEVVELYGNNFNFQDLLTIKRILNFKQISTTFSGHYVPQAGLDSTTFVYAPQEDIGIGGIRRRAPGSSILLSAGVGIIAEESTITNYLTNQYTWERIDTVGLSGGTVANPVTETLGFAQQSGGMINQNLNASNTSGDPSFLIGVDTTASNIHRLAIPFLDSVNHNSWLYRAEIKNDSFPSLVLHTVPKKIEVDYCTDSSGAIIFCQSMIVQFDPDSLVQFSTAQQQDSFRNALREELGAGLIESCLCGDIELWAISDTARAMLESNGKGTKRSASVASGRPELLSGDPNYPLLASSSNPSSSAVNLPAGSGNSTAKTLVAIIDSGVDYDYPALTPYISEGATTTSNCLPNALFGYNFVHDNNNATDEHGHGTSVAGIVAGISQQSILPDTGSMKTDIGILPLKYTDKNGSGSLFHAACAMRYAADYERPTTSGGTAKVRVINTSWGYYGDPCIVLENVIVYAGEDCDILIVASAGNDSLQVHGNMADRHWPSNSIWGPSNPDAVDNILAVAGLAPNGNSLDNRSNYSNLHIDLAAPWNENTTLAGSINGFNVVGGTSFSAPQVSRAAALLFDKYPDASYFAVKYALMNGVDILPHTDSTKLVSGGRINYAKADSILNRITDRTACTPNFIISTENVQELGDQIKIYPNPVSDVLTLEFNYTLAMNNIELRIFNLNGQEVNRQNVSSGTTSTNISTENLPAGVYFIQVMVGEKQYTQKVIKF
jgi:subtilisin family serine protease